VKRTAAVLAALCVAATGCGQVRVSGHSTPVTPQGAKARAHQATYAANRMAAAREADRLLSLARLPKRATPLGTLPRSLSQPNMGVAVATTLIDQHQAWQVPMSMDALARWVRGHAPAHLQASGSSSSTDRRGLVARGFSFDDRAGSDAWEQASLIVSIASIGAGSSAIRLDGMVVWLDPRPQRDSARGHRVHLDVADACPRSLAGVVGVRNGEASTLRHALLPAADPAGGVVCRYPRAGAGPMRRHLSTDLAGRVAAAVRRLRLSHADGEIFSCPADFGAVTIAVLHYRGGDVDLWVRPTGCATLANGYIQAMGRVAALS